MMCIFKEAKGLKQFIKNIMSEDSEAELQIYLLKSKLKLQATSAK